MAHPEKHLADASANAKMRKMTAHYGDADPAMKKLAPVNKYKEEGGEDAVGFGADSDAPNARSDRPARRTTAANPVATYAKGGSVIARAKGGRTKKHGSTHVNVIVSPPGAGGPPGGPPPGAMPPPAIALPPPGMPPGMPPGAPPPGAAPPPPKPMMGPPMPPPGSMPPPGLPPRAKGGKVGHPDEKEDRKLVKAMIKSDALKHHNRADGGAVTGKMPKMPHMTAGSGSGVGRQELNKDEAKGKHHKPEEVTG